MRAQRHQPPGWGLDPSATRVLGCQGVPKRLSRRASNQQPLARVSLSDSPSRLAPSRALLGTCSPKITDLPSPLHPLAPWHEFGDSRTCPPPKHSECQSFGQRRPSSDAVEILLACCVIVISPKGCTNSPLPIGPSFLPLPAPDQAILFSSLRPKICFCVAWLLRFPFFASLDLAYERGHLILLLRFQT